MANGVFDIFRGEHERLLGLLTGVRVTFDKEADLFCLYFQAKGSIPPVWLRRLGIELRHDSLPVQETIVTEWTDVEGSMVVATCPRPRTILPDDEVSAMGTDILPVGDVILLAGFVGQTRTLSNAGGLQAFRKRPMRSGSEEDD